MTLFSWIQRAASAAHDCFASDLDSDLSFEISPTSLTDAGSTRRTTNDRYCIVLTADPPPDVATRVAAWKTLEEKASLVPPGETHLVANLEAKEPVFAQATDQQPGVRTNAFYLDRCAVTNEQYFAFVSDGGYNQQDLWPSEILPHVLQFVDQTGHPSPKSWSNGRPPTGKQNHPVVGVCWFEATAYALWSGRRLPTAAEWQRAATWCSDGATGEARYPWGNAFDPQRANTWHSHHGDTVPVDEYSAGATLNGISQLIGNTWEWTADGFDGCLEGGSRIIFDRPMAEVRGASFDTYLETQATGQFRTAQPLLHRGRNVGFRCCVSVQDLPSPPDPSALLEFAE